MAIAAPRPSSPATTADAISSAARPTGAASQVHSREPQAKRIV
jgi:hypothetical protein